MIRHAAKGRSRGQSLVEFSLVVPLLLLVVFSIIEFGRFIFSYEVLNNAAREGVRYAIVHGSDSLCPSGPMPGGATSPSSCADPSGAAIQDQVMRSAFTLGVTASQIAVTWPNVDNARGHDVSLSVTYTFRTLIPLPLPPISMTARSTLVINY